MSLDRIRPVAIRLANRAEGMSNADLCTAENLSASAARAYIASFVNEKVIFKGHPEGKHPRYFGTIDEAERFQDRRVSPPAPTAAAATPSLIARAAVAFMRQGQTRSSFDLADLCHASVDLIDLALGPLVDAKKLVRLPVQRSGVTMFDYRFSATWKPVAEDFEICKGDGIAPKAAVSPVAAPPAKPETRAAAPAPRAAVAPVARPISPAPLAPTPEGKRDSSVIAERETSGYKLLPSTAEMCKELTVEAATGSLSLSDWLNKPRTLGFKLTADELPGTTEQVEEPETFTTAGGDLVCALNSRGELAIDMGTSGTLQFTPQEALTIKRFLENTSVLEELAGRGAL